MPFIPKSCLIKNQSRRPITVPIITLRSLIGWRRGSCAAIVMAAGGGVCCHSDRAPACLHVRGVLTRREREKKREERERSVRAGLLRGGVSPVAKGPPCLLAMSLRTLPTSLSPVVLEDARLGARVLSHGWRPGERRVNRWALTVRRRVTD